MAEEEVSYASVVFKPNKNPPHQASSNSKKVEETVYDEVKTQRETTEQTAATNSSLPDKKPNDRRCHYQQLACCLGVFCVILLLGVIAVSVYLVTLSNTSDDKELQQLKDNQTTLLALTSNLTRASAVLESKITNLTAEIQDLKTQRNNLTQQIQNMERNSNELNISRAQWSIDAYCPNGSNGRKCNACQKGWDLFQSSCYAFNDAAPLYQKPWEEAGEDCRRKISDLAVIHNDTKKGLINGKIWVSSAAIRFWIGLRAEEGTWKWVDGSNLTQSSRIQQPPTNGLCVTSDKTNVWKAVNCSDKYTWLCKKKALSV